MKTRKSQSLAVMTSADRQQYFEEIFEEEDPWFHAVSEFEQTKYYRQVALAKDRSTPRRICEIGCAEGVHTAILAKEFPDSRIIGVDISLRALQRASRRLRDHRTVSLIAADLVTVASTLPAEAFDLILWSESFVYLEQQLSACDYRDLIHRVAALLQSGGILCTSNSLEKISAQDPGSPRVPAPRFHHLALSEALDCVTWTQYCELKDEHEASYRYEIVLYQRQENRRGLRRPGAAAPNGEGEPPGATPHSRR